MTIKTYATKSNATRAAKNFAAKHGVEFETTGSKESGFRAVVTCITAEQVKAATNAGLAVVDHTETPAEEPKKSKSGYIRGNSTVGGACSLVHMIADQMTAENPEVTRKEVMAACMKAGVTYGTARTQYQKWKNNN